MAKATYWADMEDELMFAQVIRVSNGSGGTFSKAKSEIIEACQQEIKDMQHTIRRIRSLRVADVESSEDEDDNGE